MDLRVFSSSGSTASPAARSRGAGGFPGRRGPFAVRPGARKGTSGGSSDPYIARRGSTGCLSFTERPAPRRADAPSRARTSLFLADVRRSLSPGSRFGITSSRPIIRGAALRVTKPKGGRDFGLSGSGRRSPPIQPGCRPWGAATRPTTSLRPHQFRIDLVTIL